MAGDEEVEAVKALSEFSRERWGWGTNEYEDVHDAVGVVIAALDRVRSRSVSGTEPDTACTYCGQSVKREVIDPETGESFCGPCAVELAVATAAQGTEPDTAKLVQRIVYFLRYIDWPDDTAADAVEREFLAGFSVDAGKAEAGPDDR